MSGDVTRGERLQIMLTPEELAIVDDWRFSRRMPSRAAAVRELLKRGLAADGFSTAGHHLRSTDFGLGNGQPRLVDGNGRDGSGDGEV